ncbi:right-handed parallel beta-helix repeat-containing protein [Candidatus Nitrospira nitrificans]|nr:pectinesterase family protein [Candidatus Nitrospira nitrificans]
MRPVFLTAVLLWLTGAGFAIAQAENPAPAPRTITVALDGSGDFASIQEAVDSAGKGDTVLIKAGTYAQDLTIHSKEKIKIVGAGVDTTVLQGRGTMVGVLHVGKWPYGATDIDISGLTINEHGGHALGIFNGTGITLHHLHVKGMVFGQQVQGVRIEDCVIGGSETTGVHVTDSQVQLIGNFIHDNDYGVNVTGKSDIRLDRNIITRSGFEAIVVNDQAKAVLTNNTLVKNGGGAAFLGSSTIEASGNILSFNKIGFLIAASSQTKTSYNALFNSDGNYVRAGSPNVPAPELQAESDITTDPGFVDMEHDDFRLKPDTTLLKRGAFRYLGALPPLPIPAHNR